MPLGCSDISVGDSTHSSSIEFKAQKHQIKYLVLHEQTNNRVAIDLLVHHEAKDAHHGGTAVVELNGTLAELGVLAEGVPAEVEGAIAEIAGELGLAGDVLHDEELKDANEGDDLEKAGLGDGAGSVDGRKTVGEGIEGVSGLVDAARKVDAVAGDDLAKEGLLYEIHGKQEAIRT